MKYTGNKVLVACEESQVVTAALRVKGVAAFSCDTAPCSGGNPDWHLQQNVLELLNLSWLAIIAFPPCTHLAVSGARWFPEKRADGRQQAAIKFFQSFINADCRYLMIENPVGIMSTLWRRPDQIIQPWQFGHGETKKTCLWLRNLPILEPTNIVDGREPRIHYMAPGPDRARLRSRTYQGVANAIANQWGPTFSSNILK